MSLACAEPAGISVMRDMSPQAIGSAPVHSQSAAPPSSAATVLSREGAAVPRLSCSGLQSGSSRPSQTPDHPPVPTQRALSAATSAQASSARAVNGAGYPAVAHEGSRPHHLPSRSEPQHEERLQPMLAHTRAQPVEAHTPPSTMSPFLPARTEPVDAHTAFSGGLRAAHQPPNGVSPDAHFLCDEGEAAFASGAPALELPPPPAQAAPVAAPPSQAPEYAPPSVALQDSQSSAAELLLRAAHAGAQVGSLAQTAAPLRQAGGVSSVCTQMQQLSGSAGAAAQASWASPAGSGAVHPRLHESDPPYGQQPHLFLDPHLEEYRIRDHEQQLRQQHEHLLAQQQRQAEQLRRQQLIEQQLAHDRQLMLIREQQQMRMQPHHFPPSTTHNHLQHLDQSVPPQLYADETLAPPPVEDVDMLTPTAEDDGVAALLLGFGAAPRIEAPRTLPPRKQWGHSAYASYSAPGAGAEDVRGRGLQQNERPPAVVLPARKRASVGGRLRRDAAEMDTDDIRDQEIASAHRRGQNGGDSGWLEDDYAAQRRRVDSDTDEEAEESEPGGAVLADVIDLHNLSPRDAIGLRLQVSYMERQGKQLVAVPYRGEVVSVDLRKGLRVKLDGYVRREWVTDEDEWSWLEKDDQGVLPHVQELIDRAEEAAGKGKASSKTNGSAAKPAAAAASGPSYAHVQIKLRGTFAVRMPACVRLMPPPQKPVVVSSASEGSEGEEEMPADEGARQQLPPSSNRHEHNGKALSSAEQMEVTVCAGAHAGEKAKVLHVGNGWVRVEVESGSVVHLRKWDLAGEIPSKLRSPGHIKPLAKLESVEEPEAIVAGALGPSPRDERAAERAALVAGKEAESSASKGSDSGSGKGAGKSSSGKGAENSAGKGIDDSAGKRVEKRCEKIAGSSSGKGAEGGSGKGKENSSVKGAENSVSKGAENSSSKGSEGRRSDVAKEAGPPAPRKEADTPAAPAEAPPVEAAAALPAPAPKPRKRPPAELAAEGFQVGAAVWARLSFIKFSHGVIQKVQSSSKWVMVRLDGGTDQWVTARELVLDSTPEQGDLHEGLEVIAAWPGEEQWYKGTIIEVTDRGGYRVQYDDWDEQTVGLAQLRTLPETFGGKRKKEHEPKHKHAAAGSASTKPVSQGSATPATAKSATKVEGSPAAACVDASGTSGDAGAASATDKSAAAKTEGAPASSMDTSATNITAGARAGVAAEDGISDACQPDPIYASMERFVSRARDELLASSPDTFDRLSQLLAGFEGATAIGGPEHDASAAGRQGASAAGPQLQTLLAPHPSLLTELEALLALAPSPAPSGDAQSVAPFAHAETSVEMEVDESSDGVWPVSSAAAPASSPVVADVQQEEPESNSPPAAPEDSSDADELSTKLVSPDVDPVIKGECRQERSFEESRGHKSKGTRELQKLLDEFGGGAAVGVDGDMRRRRACHEA